tara:strand:+ start:118 stop:345 length:228 start_codon:yes stop_codon:yes gene_type:complete
LTDTNKIKKENTFSFCDDQIKSLKEDVICSQDNLHKSIEGNPLAFIIFYVFTVIFIALLFQMSTKNFSNKGKKNK